jgi:hypothetical protein
MAKRSAFRVIAFQSRISNSTSGGCMPEAFSGWSHASSRSTAR